MRANHTTLFWKLIDSNAIDAYKTGITIYLVKIQIDNKETKEIKSTLEKINNNYQIKNYGKSTLFIDVILVVA